MSVELEPALGEALLQRGAGSSRPAVEERGPVGRLETVDADRRARGRAKVEVDRLEHPGAVVGAGRPAAGRARPRGRRSGRRPTRSRPRGGRGSRGAANGASAVEACVIRAGMLDQALDAAERLGEQEELRPRDERDRLLLGLGEERDHAAEVAHLARARPRGRGGRRGRGRARARPPGGRRGTPAIARAFSQCWRMRSASVFMPAQDEPAVERARARRRATSAGSAAAPRASSSFVRDEAADHVGVAAEVLRRRVDDDVGAELERLLEVRRREGVVDDEQRAGRVRRLGGARGCRRCSAAGSTASRPRRARVVVEVRGEVLVELLGRDVREAVALRLVDLRGHAVDAAVDVGDQRRRARPGRRGASASSSRRARRRTRCRARRPRGSRGGLERRARRVRDARVVVALVLADRLLHVGRGLVDRRDDRAGRRVGLLARRGSRASRTPWPESYPGSELELAADHRRGAPFCRSTGSGRSSASGRRWRA